MKHINNIYKLPLKEKAYLLIKEKIIKCELLPGSVISDKQLQEELGIGRTPVREAILRLNQEKLLIIYPRKGIIVSPITIKEINDVFKVRQILEPSVAKLGCSVMKKEDLLNFKNKFLLFIENKTALNKTDYFELDHEFHKYIISCGKSEPITNFMDGIYDLDYRIRVMSTFDMNDLKDRSVKGHEQIIDALLEQDYIKIEESIKAHLDDSRKVALLRIY